MICEDCGAVEKLVSQEYAIPFRGQSLRLTGVSVYQCACEERTVEIPNYSRLLKRARRNPEIKHWRWDQQVWRVAE